MPRKPKYTLPAGAAVTAETVTPPASSPEPIRSQITKLSGFDNIDEVINAAPDAAQVQAGEDSRVGPNGRKLRRDGTERAAKKPRGTVNVDDPMNDPRYRQSIAGMNFYGAPRVIKRGFKTVATLTHDAELDLNDDENKAIDDYFYAVSKHTSFDPMASIVGRVLLLILLIGEIVGSRILMRSEFGKSIKEMLTRDKSETSTMQDNGVVRSGVVGEDSPFETMGE